VLSGVRDVVAHAGEPLERVHRVEVSPNPTLMRLREIEALEKVAEKGRLSVVVGEGGLAGRVVKLV
jgi:hypothetical protein